MHIVIVNNTKIPVFFYGGTERVIWDLGKALSLEGHKVSYLVAKGSSCDFAQIIEIDEQKTWHEQIPQNADIVHFNFTPPDAHKIKKPYLVTIHGNTDRQDLLDKNTVFVSQNHAHRHGSESFVHNGLDWSAYSKPDFSKKSNYFHFLGNAAWRVKNVKGAIEVIKKTKKEHLKVLGGVRFNFKQGIRLTFSPRISFEGMVGGESKNRLLEASKGLIFPVRWHEPFGLAITESLFFGCPVFGTPYGSLPELVHKEVGFLSNSSDELANAVENSQIFSPKKCWEYAQEFFNHQKMAQEYLKKYEQVLMGKNLNAHSPQLQVLPTQKFLEWS